MYVKVNIKKIYSNLFNKHHRRKKSNINLLLRNYLKNIKILLLTLNKKENSATFRFF